MHRRTLLSLACGAATAASVGGLLGLRGLLASFADVRSSTIFPGAELKVTLDKATPAGARLVVAITHAQQRHACVSSDAIGGGEFTLHVPYPFDDLVPGEYSVDVELFDVAGRRLERHAAGAYTLKPVRFSV